MQVIVSKVLVVFIYIAIGLVANRLRVLPEESLPYLTALVINITTPCLMITSITGEELRDGMLKSTILTFILSFVLLLLAALIAVWRARRFRNTKPEDAGVLSVAMTSCNSGFMGFPITQSVFGSTAFYFLVVQNISFNLYLFIVAIAQLHWGEPRSGKLNLRSMLRPFCNILTIVSVISVVLLFAHIHLPVYFNDLLSTVGDATIPLSMIIVGIQLGRSNFRKLLFRKDLLQVSLYKLILFPAMSTLIVFLLPLEPYVRLSLALAMCFPSAVLGVAMAEREGKNGTLMAEAVAVTTLYSMVTLPLWLSLLGHLFLS
ncbi:MAG: AEC family transporter [Mogibacterium sp.]|nr:AEC family transporter [Mogibacterium sp.]